MAPERTGTLAVLDLNFRGTELISSTQILTSLTEEGTDPNTKLYVDWNSITIPPGYIPVAEGAAFVRNANNVGLGPFKEETLARTASGAYFWENTISSSWLLLIVVLPSRFQGSVDPSKRTRAKVFKDRLILIVWADTPPHRYFRAEITISQIAPGFDLQLEKERINSQVNENILAIPDVVLPLHQSDLCVVTALQEPEFSALMEIEWKWSSFKEPRDPYTNYKVGSYGGANGDRRRVIAAYSSDMGMPAATTLATKMIHLFAPRYIAMVGILAGIEGKCSLGDVIAVNRSWDYGSGKWKRQGDNTVFEPAPNQIELERSLKGQLEEMKNDWKFFNDIRGEWERRKNPRHALPKLEMHLGPVASGAAVIAAEDYVKGIKDQHRKVIGIEMEAHAIFVSAREAGLPFTRAFVLKSVCDFADFKKGDEYQDYAAYTSACALRHFAENYLNYE